jgi:hypothetical protein
LFTKQSAKVLEACKLVPLKRSFLNEDSLWVGKSSLSGKGFLVQMMTMTEISQPLVLLAISSRAAATEAEDGLAVSTLVAYLWEL